MRGLVPRTFLPVPWAPRPRALLKPGHTGANDPRGEIPWAIHRITRHAVRVARLHHHATSCFLGCFYLDRRAVNARHELCAKRGQRCKSRKEEPERMFDGPGVGRSNRKSSLVTLLDGVAP